MVYRFFILLLTLVSICSNAHSSEKDKYFARQCFEIIRDNWLIPSGVNVGTKLDNKYAYWPLTKDKEYESYYNIDVEIGVVYGWGEVKKKISYCRLNDAGEVTSWCGSNECFK